MDEEKFTREKKSSRSNSKASGRTGTTQKSMGDKLKNETTSGEAMRKKLRHGKADNIVSKEDAKNIRKVKRQGRKKIQRETAVSATTHNQISNSNEDNNAGTESLNRGTQVAEEGIYKAKQNHYSNRLHEIKAADNIAEEEMAKKGTSSNAVSREFQKKRVRKEMESAAQKKAAKESANSFGSLSKKFVDKSEELAGMIGEFIAEHPMEIAIAVAIGLLLLVLISSLSSCSMIGGGVQNVTIATTFTADDADIIAVEAAYKDKEAALQNTIDHIESDHPGYDEYRYTLAEIGHNPFQLAALLTVLYEDYSESEVQTMLQTIYDRQYKLTVREIVEVRTRTETRTGHRTVHHADGTTSSESYTYEVEVEYNYYILQTTLVNNTWDTVMAGLNLTADQQQRYALLMETYGNKPDIFGDDVNAVADPGDYPDYQVPPEALADQRFANMLNEAEKYLGYPYVWGGSSPSTSFDCSGFVSYVINHCGNGWNVGRSTANGLLNSCTRVSAADAKPGDLIFFQGTYDTSGASHVGIYVGNGMMIHCGNPIKYASVNTSYWQNHFLCYGRIN
ncbi:MAG: NlpC/P60 family protein [Lachnospiraceae bacterium]|nr:NlpC/P60 family protein [Lachnospiraceae bacterium]